jgi:hypothetical protein
MIKNGFKGKIFCLRPFNFLPFYTMLLEPLHPIQLKRFHEMSFSEKLSVAQGLWLMARNVRLAAARRRQSQLIRNGMPKNCCP